MTARVVDLSESPPTAPRKRIAGRGIGSAVDLVSEDESSLDDRSDGLPRFAKRAFMRLCNLKPSCDTNRIRQALRRYIDIHPGERSVARIVEAVQKEVNSPPRKSPRAAFSSSPTVILLDIDSDSNAGEEFPSLDDAKAFMLSVLPYSSPTQIELALTGCNQNAIMAVDAMSSASSATPDGAGPSLRTRRSAQRWAATESYRTEALVQLEHNFPFVKSTSLSHALEKAQGRYFIAARQVGQACGVGPHLDPTPAPALSAAVWAQVLQRVSEQFPGMLVEVPRTSNAHQPPPQDHALRCEVAWLRHQQLRTLPPAAVVASLSSAALSQRLVCLGSDLPGQGRSNASSASGSMVAMAASTADDNDEVECGCCFSGCAFESLVQCSEGHLFCQACLRHYIEQTVFGNGQAALRCLSSSGDPCGGFFSDATVRRVLPPRAWERFSEATTRAAVKAARIHDLVHCHSCPFEAQLPEEAGNVLVCPDCGKHTCRLCQEAAHVPLRCSEVEKPAQTSARVGLEEALTQARVRQCPSCRTRFFKTEGCNKMTCACGALLCYLCRASISQVGYGHFCQVAHCDHRRCHKCRIHTDSVQDDRLAMYEAGLQVMATQADSERIGEGETEGEGKSDGVSEEERHRLRQELLAKLLDGGLPQAALATAASTASTVAAAAATGARPTPFGAAGAAAGSPRRALPLVNIDVPRKRRRRPLRT